MVWRRVVVGRAYGWAEEGGAMLDIPLEAREGEVDGSGLPFGAGLGDAGGE